MKRFSIDRLVGAIVTVMNNIGTVFIIGLMVLINLDVLFRNIANSPIPGVIELAEAGIVMVVFLQIGHTLRVGKMTRSDGFLNWLQRQYPVCANSLNVFYNLTGALLFVFMLLALKVRFIESWQGGYYKGVQGSFVMPVWPIDLTLCLGALAMIIQFLILVFVDLNTIGKQLKREVR